MTEGRTSSMIFASSPAADATEACQKQRGSSFSSTPIIPESR
jgi:hypothetical protein